MVCALGLLCKRTQDSTPGKKGVLMLKPAATTPELTATHANTWRTGCVYTVVPGKKGVLALKLQSLQQHCQSMNLCSTNCQPLNQWCNVCNTNCHHSLQGALGLFGQCSQQGGRAGLTLRPATTCPDSVSPIHEQLPRLQIYGPLGLHVQSFLQAQCTDPENAASQQTMLVRWMPHNTQTHSITHRHALQDRCPTTNR